jgi:hypothetical protein
MSGASVDHRLGEAPHPTLSPAEGRGTAVVVTTPVAVEVVLNVCCNACRTSPSPLGEKVAEGRIRGPSACSSAGQGPLTPALSPEGRGRRVDAIRPTSSMAGHEPTILGHVRAPSPGGRSPRPMDRDAPGG